MMSIIKETLKDDNYENWVNINKWTDNYMKNDDYITIDCTKPYTLSNIYTIQ